MSRWKDKFVIGLTGNIGTGKSVVRRMLESLGAYGIDADALAHRVIEQDAPGYEPVLSMFGSFILRSNGEINRRRLGRIAFNDPEALAVLEEIIHPLVSTAVDLTINRASHHVIVIEAIKLLEGSLAQDCESTWVTYAPPGIQLDRLTNRRKMKTEEAKQRIHSQTAQETKMRAADVVIDNSSTFENTWSQVMKAWQRVVPSVSKPNPEAALQGQPGELVLQIANPAHAAEIAGFLNQQRNDRHSFDRATVMEAFGELSVLLLRQDDRLVGLAEWQAENFIARMRKLTLDASISVGGGLAAMLAQMEEKAKDLQCEVSLVFLQKPLTRHSAVWEQQGYCAVNEIQELLVPAWIDAAQQSMPPNTTLVFKKLREKRLLRPI